MSSSITGSPGKFELISARQPGNFIVFGLILCTGIAGGLSIFAIFFYTGLVRGAFFVSGITLYVSYLILRFALWNLYGKEIIRYSGKSLSHQFDYKYFRSNPRTLNGKITRITLTELLGEPEIHPEENENHLLDNPARSFQQEIVFHIGQHRITTTTGVPHEMIEQFFDMKLASLINICHRRNHSTVCSIILAYSVIGKINPF